MKNGESRVSLKIVGIILVISMLFGAVLFAVIADEQSEKRAKENLDLYMAESYDLRLERQTLMLEYANIEKYTLNQLADGSFIGLVFTGVEKQLYTSVFQNMNQRANPLVGMMCLKSNALPGDAGMISVEEYNQMREAGWDIALYYNGMIDLVNFLADMKAQLTSRGFEMPTTVLFAKKTYSTAYNHTLEAYGITNALHHGDERIEIIEKGVDGIVWNPGVLYWNIYGMSSATLAEVTSVGGIAYFEFTFGQGNPEEENYVNSQVRYDENEPQRVQAFLRMLDKIESYVVKDKVNVDPIELARLNRTDYLTIREGLLEAISIRKQEILNELDRVNAAIGEIYLKYNSGK